VHSHPSDLTDFISAFGAQAERIPQCNIPPKRKSQKMKSEKDSLATLSNNQANAFLAMPEDFEITRDDDEIFHGQSSDKLLKGADAECERKPAKRSTATEPDNASKSRN
jgi:ABC-type Fe3+/spermidine/putrescine transport system ATPase subunit